MVNLYNCPTKLGQITIAEERDAIIALYFPGEPIPPGASMQETPLLKRASEQLIGYLAGELKAFKLPLAPQGTDFMRLVWEQLQKIPYGETRSYKQIAESVGSPRASRAVGQANHRNPIPIFIPCHRVIGSSGKLVGYGGGLPIKMFLLEIEKITTQT
ncbi:MAG: methylated-DNA--[protein]-cysteine S-methyltransferase [Syntrophomonadaceae bacterium]